MCSEDPVAFALRTPLVVHHIFSHLSVPDLLSCSEVNRVWNLESRRILRDHRKCIVQADCSKHCDDLALLDQAIATMNVVPFNSLRITVGKDCLNDLRDYPAVTGHKWKHLEVHSSTNQVFSTLEYVMYCNQFKQCPAADVARKILQAQPNGLEELDVRHTPEEAGLWEFLLENFVYLLKMRVVKLPFAAGGGWWGKWIEPYLEYYPPKWEGGGGAAGSVNQEEVRQLLENQCRQTRNLSWSAAPMKFGDSRVGQVVISYAGFGF